MTIGHEVAGHRRRRITGFIYILIATLLWSIIPICVKVAAQTFDTYSITWMRFSASGILFFAVGRGLRTFTPLRGGDLRLALIGAAGIAWNYLCFLRGLEDTTASAANLVIQFEVVVLVILGRFWLKERIGRVRMIGLLITFLGVGLVVWNGEDLSSLVTSRYFFGNMLILVSAPLWAVYAVCQKLLAGRGVPVASSLAYIMGAAAVFTLPAMLIGFELRGPVTANTVTSLSILILLSTAGSYALIAKGLEYLEASIAGMITCLLPVFTIGAARIFLNEILTLFVAAGALLVVFGLLVIGRAETTEPNQTQGCV